MRGRAIRTRRFYDLELLIVAIERTPEGLNLEASAVDAILRPTRTNVGILLADVARHCPRALYVVARIVAEWQVRS